jgi:CheY-like chemotaxis protein
MSAHAGLSADLVAGLRARRRSRLHGRRILYVDDELLMRQAAIRLLRGTGAICLCTGTHDQAVVLLATEPLLDLAVLDFQMPDGDVGRLVQRLHRLRPALPLAGTSASDRRSEFAVRGVARFLPKPWVLDDLIHVADWSEALGSQVPVSGPQEPAVTVQSSPVDRIHSFGAGATSIRAYGGPSLPR